MSRKNKVNSKSLIWGMVGTVVWLLIIFLFSILKGYELPNSLNELGDALAGIVAPIAFFWLILGYVQQGKQLEQNTRALEQQEEALQLQISEMKESVQQQKELAEIQIEQLKMTKKEVRPFLHLSTARCNLSQEKYELLCENFEKETLELKFLIKNEGRGEAKNIEIYMERIQLVGNIYRLSVNETYSLSICLKGNSLEKLISKKDEFLFLKIKFKDIYDSEFIAFYDLKLNLDSTNGEVTQVNIMSYQNINNSQVAN